MKKITQKQRPEKYRIVDDQTRKQIVEKIFRDKMKIKDVSEMFQIPLSTVKAVKSVFQKEGRIQKKAKRTRNKKLVTTIIVAVVDKNKIPTDLKEIEKHTQVQIGSVNRDENMTEQCMKQGIEILAQMLDQIRRNQATKGRHSRMLQQLMKDYQQQCQTFN